MDHFYKRFFFKTIKTLQKLDTLPDIILSQEESINLTLFSLKEYYTLYKKYCCVHVKQNTLVFCGCFNLYQLFVRNKALLLCDDVNFVESTIKLDEFLMYLEGLITKNSRIFKKVCEKNELFWEAYDYLEELPNVKSGLGNKLLTLHKLKKGILLEDKKIELMPFLHNFPAFLGAYFYHKKEYDIALPYLEKHFLENEEVDFVDLLSNILYLKKDKKIGIIAYNAYKLNKFRSETLIAVANYFSYKKDHFNSIKYFLNAIKLDPKFNICYTLIGNEFMELKDYQEAIKNYTLSVKLTKDHRAWFGLAQAYTALRNFRYALVFYRICVTIKPADPFFWLTFGNCYSKLKKDDCAKCFLKAYSLGEKEGLIYLADYYKNQKKYSDSVKYYEKYVNDGGKESKRIIEFLVEYFTRLGNKKKVCFYKEKLKEM
ncbi:cell division control CDC23 [Tubulinosema ratisbonensis]|uniref:Cell division control CDC23 n=1 Tax=Tubulinosema ratisbonensis TaxID=291195 RepID=A0A437AQF2_9MICR|nr:cell division control CDC23 [Tubulinosema ratisbonensis]